MNFIQQFFQIFGFDIQRSKSSIESLGFSSKEYERLKSNIRYSPWNSNSDFCHDYNVIKERTMVDRIRCFEIWKSVEQTAKLDRGRLLEVGVWRGGTGALIALQSQRCQIREKLYLCDTFKGVVKAGDSDSTYRGSEHSDASASDVEDFLSGNIRYGETQVLEGVFPEETGKILEEEVFRFCHIDVDVYRSTRDIVDWVWPRIVVGGLVLIDDFGMRSCDGVTRAVEEEMAKDGRVVFGSISGQALIVKTG